MATFMRQAKTAHMQAIRMSAAIGSALIAVGPINCLRIKVARVVELVNTLDSKRQPCRNT